MRLSGFSLYLSNSENPGKKKKKRKIILNYTDMIIMWFLVGWLIFSENIMFNHNDVSLVLLDGRVQFHTKSAIFQSQYLYQTFNYPTIQ